MVPAWLCCISGIFLRTSFGSFLPHDNRESCIRRQTSDPCFLAGKEVGGEGGWGVGGGAVEKRGRGRRGGGVGSESHSDSPVPLLQSAVKL